MFKRKPPAGQTPPQIGNSSLITIERNYRLITPLMGGGVKASENDLSFLIRPSSIRGQLRFWWRACFGGSEDLDTDILPDEPAQQRWLLEQMFERESALFGKAADKQSSGASALQVEVQVTNSGSQFRATTSRGQEVKISAMNSPYGYAAFPLQDKPNASVREGIEFKLTLRFMPSDANKLVNLLRLAKDSELPQAEPVVLLENMLKKVLWAWQTFGGIGARTRRGFGVLQRIDSQVDHYAFTNKAQLERQIKEIIGNRSHWPNDVPHLSADPKLRLIKPKPNQGALEIWADLLRRYKDFRQQRNEGNQPNRPGRSRWPEPDALRRLTRQRSRLHEPVSELDAFPRGEFGLPIIFHFKDSDDPVDSELRLQANPEPTQQKGDRFASPMLLKPVASNGQLFGLIAVLEGSTLNGRQPIIKNRRITAAAVTIKLAPEQIDAIVDKNHRPLLTDQSIITSFLATIEE